ncbi:hypothetical protein WMF27_39235 [Sorangium sp. So ce281]
MNRVDRERDVGLALGPIEPLVREGLVERPEVQQPFFAEGDA